MIIDEPLPKLSRVFLEQLRLGDLPSPQSSLQPPQDEVRISKQTVEDSPADPNTYALGFTQERIEVPLVSDGMFFEVLQSDVGELDALQAREEKAMREEIVSLGLEVAHLSKPSRICKNDLARWRTIFELYLEAQVFFSTYERDHGARDSRRAARQLQWFQNEVTKRNLQGHFKMNESRVALARFMQLNAVLLKNVRFQEINNTAVYKILKKFDKRTSLGVSKTFTKQFRSDGLLAGSMAKDICAQVSSQLVSVVPQLDDYLCPVCFAIAYRPVRLACKHVYCIRCVVKMQRRRESHCPLCRADAVMTCSAGMWFEVVLACTCAKMFLPRQLGHPT